MIDFYFNLAPNPMKVALCLEEMGLEFGSIPVDTKRGQQFSAEFSKLNPNNKVPCIVDGQTIVFDSNAILLYLGEKTNSFMPPDSPACRGELLSWLMFVATGLGPFSGQAVHFRHWAPQPNPYSSKRYDYEARRHYHVLEGRLSDRHYALGDVYTIVDMAIWGWARLATYVMGEGIWIELPHVKRLVDEISARPAAERALTLAKRHAFKQETDQEALGFLYRHRNSDAG